MSYSYDNSRATSPEFGDNVDLLKSKYESMIMDYKLKILEQEAEIKKLKSEDSKPRIKSGRVRISKILEADLLDQIDIANKRNEELVNVLSEYEAELVRWRNRAISISQSMKHGASLPLQSPRVVSSPRTVRLHSSGVPMSPSINLHALEHTNSNIPPINLSSTVSSVKSIRKTQFDSPLPVISPSARFSSTCNDDTSFQDENRVKSPNADLRSRSPKDEKPVDLQNLKQFFSTLLFCTDVDEVYQKLVNIASQLLGAERCSLFIVNEESREFMPQYFSAGSTNEHSIESRDALVTLAGTCEGGLSGIGGHGIVGSVFLSGELLNIKTATVDPRYVKEIDATSRKDVKSMLCCPLFMPHQIEKSHEALVELTKYEQKDVMEQTKDKEESSMSSSSNVVPLDQHELTQHLYEGSPSPLVQKTIEPSNPPNFSILAHLLGSQTVSKALYQHIDDNNHIRHVHPIKASSVLVVYNKNGSRGKVQTFNKQDQLIMSMLTSYTSQIIWDIFVLSVYQREREKTRALLLGTDALVRGPDIRSLLSNVAQSMRTNISADFVVLFGCDEIEEELIALGIDCELGLLIRLPNSFTRSQKIQRRAEEQATKLEELQMSRMRGGASDISKRGSGTFGTPDFKRSVSVAPPEFARKKSMFPATVDVTREAATKKLTEMDPSVAVQIEKDFPSDEPLRVSYASGGLALTAVSKNSFIHISDALSDRRFNISLDEYLTDRVAVPVGVKSNNSKKAFAEALTKSRRSSNRFGGALTRSIIYVPIADIAAPEIKGNLDHRSPNIGVAVIGRTGSSDFEINDILQLDDLLQLASVAIRKYKATDKKDSFMKVNMGRISSYLSRLESSQNNESTNTTN